MALFRLRRAGAALFCLAVAWPLVAMAMTPKETACAEMALRVERDTASGPALERARLLERKERECVGTGSFDVTLAALYQEGGALGDADRVAQRGLERPSSYRPNLMQVLAMNQLRRGRTDEAYQMGLEIARAYPKYAPIFGFLGGIDAQLKRWDGALANAQRLNEIEGNALSYLVMASVLHQLDRHAEVVVAVDRALELEPGRVGRTTGVLEGVYSLLIFNRRDEAARLVKRHMEANPNWRQDPAMVRAARELGLVKN